MTFQSFGSTSFEKASPLNPFAQKLGLPFLVHGRTQSPDGFSWLDVANMSAFRKATNFLLDLGHKRIALINGQENLDFAARRRVGFCEAIQACGLAPNPDWMRSDVMTEGYGYTAAAEMLAGDVRPTAFLVSSVISALGVHRAVADRGLFLGRDVSLITYDDLLSYLNNDVSGPVFTATRSSIRAAGQRCAEILITLIGSPDHSIVQELWEPELTVGRSTGPAPADTT